MVYLKKRREEKEKDGKLRSKRMVKVKKIKINEKVIKTKEKKDRRKMVAGNKEVLERNILV